MATAKSNLEALLVNDPEHPAIRHFVLVTKAIIEAADRRKNVQADVAALVCIKGEMEILERQLTST